MGNLCGSADKKSQNSSPGRNGATGSSKKGSRKRNHSPDDSWHNDVSIRPEKTHGIVKFTLLRAELPQDTKKVHATVSVGLQSFLSTTESSSFPTWNQGHNFVLQKVGGGSMAQISIFSKKNGKGQLMCYAVVDLKALFDDESDALNAAVEKSFPLHDPIHQSQQVGTVWIKVAAATVQHLEETLWERLLGLVDANGDGTLQKDEFKMLMTILGNTVDDSELEIMYAKADANGDGSVCSVELAKYVTQVRIEHDLKFLRQCPVTGTDLSEYSDYNAILYVHLAMDKGSGESLQGGFKTADEANRTWMLKLSEWATHPICGSIEQFYRGNKYEAGGLNVGTRAAHILVWDRTKGIIIEELISPHLVLAMRNLYQSPVGRGMLATGYPQTALKELTEHKGKYMDSPESVKDIRPFLKSFAGRINMDEAAEPVESYTTFNEFFYRKLKSGARPIAELENHSVAVSAADCRLIVFNNVDDATRLWIKGKHFSIAGLLGDTTGKLSEKYADGSLAVFRLAPQDYHRFHFPVSGVFGSTLDIPGELFTVNPIAVNCHDVFTQNKRCVCFIDSPEFGKVAFVCIGATLVGSIVITAKRGQRYEKGDEMGYFAFGGSTTIALFPKGAVRFDNDLLEHSNKSLEVLVKMGMQIGVSSKS